MRRLLAATALSPVILGAAAHAQTSISTATTTPIATATVKNGTADSIAITAAGSIKPTTGPAVLINSSNNVTNGGAIAITGVNGAAGISALAGNTADITNTGTITVDETVKATDTDSDGDDDGPFATGNGRSGILVTSAGAPGASFTGKITNSGTIAVIGNGSAGIDIAAPLTGSLNQTGTVTVTGNDTVGIHLRGVSGAVAISGNTTVQGANATAVALDGDVGGAVLFQGTVASTGYRSTTLPNDTSKLDADDLLQGGPAIAIRGNVAGGVIFDIPPADSDAANTDEDKDGVPDASEGSATIVSYGSAPALLIGDATRDITIGAVAGKTDGLIVNGSIAGNSVYESLASTGAQIGGTGGRVTIVGGATIAGVVSGTSFNGSATGLRIGSGATLPGLTVTGTLTASGGGDAGSVIHGLQIDAGGSLASITNSGTISATSPGTLGTATAITDASGTLSSITNTGTISAGVAGSDQTGRVVAMNLAANTAGVTYTQSQSTATGAAAPAIIGDITTGSGNDLIDIRNGTAGGAMSLGGGNDQVKLSNASIAAADIDFGSGDDALQMSGTSVLAGDLAFGAGSNSLTLAGTARYSGAISATGGSLAVDVGSGTLNLSNTGTVPLSSLNVGSGGAIAVNVDGTAATATRYSVSGTAAFASGATIQLKVASFLSADKTYTVVDAGTLTGGAGVTLDTSTLPFLFKASLSPSSTAGTIDVSVSRKTAGDLGLNRSGGEAYDAIYRDLSVNADLGNSFLQLTDSAGFNQNFSQLLPDHAGGIFESVTQGSRAVARTAADPSGIRMKAGDVAFWIGQSTWREKKGLGDTGSYKIEGWAFSGGLETQVGAIGSFGAALAYMTNDVDDGRNRNQVRANQYEGMLYWRGVWGPVTADAHGSVARVRSKSERYFDGLLDGSSLALANSARWNGTLYTAGGAVAYTKPLGRIDIRPQAAIDYYKFSERAHDEIGGGSAFDLSVASRNSDELAATGSVIVGLNFGSITGDNGYARIELEGGRREIVGGQLGNTTAHFAGGSDFTLTADDLDSGFIGRLRAMGGNEGFRVGGELGAEQLQGKVAYSLRASLRLAF